jgi:hypothetical protein
MFPADQTGGSDSVYCGNVAWPAQTIFGDRDREAKLPTRNRDGANRRNYQRRPCPVLRLRWLLPVNGFIYEWVRVPVGGMSGMGLGRAKTF